MVLYENEIFEQFVDLLWKVIDQICVLVLMLNYEFIECFVVFKSFFEIFFVLVFLVNSYRYDFVKKLVLGFFV